MPSKFKSNIFNITQLNLKKLLEIQDNFEIRCFMCREMLTNENKTIEHIYPKWLQKYCNLRDQTMILPNGSTMPYRKYVVPCCKECNGHFMSEFENQISKAAQKGYAEFKNLDEEIIAWWIYKIYYAKLIKQLTLKEDIKSPESHMMASTEDLKKYDAIFYYMSQLLKGVKFKDPKPYEIYIYKTTPTPVFDYIDDISTHVIYMKIYDILIIFAADSFNLFNIQYEKEISKLNSLEIVHPLQGIELFFKIVYYKNHYKFDTEHSYFFDSTKPYIKSNLINIEQIREFNCKELYDLLKKYFQFYGIKEPFPEYTEGQMFTLIH